MIRDGEAMSLVAIPFFWYEVPGAAHQKHIEQAKDTRFIIKEQWAAWETYALRFSLDLSGGQNEKLIPISYHELLQSE